MTEVKKRPAREVITKRPDGRLRVALHFGDEPTLTKQEYKDECDINKIVERAVKQERLSEVFKTPEWNNVMVGEAVEYQQALNTVKFAEETFAKLPSKVRARFGNNALNFVEFMDNPAENGEEMVKLGLATRRDMESAGNAVPAQNSPAPAAKEAPAPATPAKGDKP